MFASAILLCLLSSPGFSQDLDFWLTAKYPFDGDATDISSFGNHGIINGTPRFVRDRFGVDSSAIYFDGSPTNYVRIPDAPHLDPPSIAISVWVTAEELGEAFHVITGKFTTESPNWWQLYWHKDMYLTLAVSGAVAARSTVDPIRVDSGWNHIVAMYQSSAEGGAIFVNGVDVTDTTLAYESRQLGENDEDLRLAQRADGKCECWIGALDDLTLYSRVLTADEVASLYRTSRPTPSEQAGIPPDRLTAYNYPNPLHSATAIVVGNPRSQRVVVEIVDLLGRHVRTLHEGYLPDGVETFLFEADALPSGLYLYNVHTERATVSGKLVLLR